MLVWRDVRAKPPPRQNVNKKPLVRNLFLFLKVMRRKRSRGEKGERKDGEKRGRTLSITSKLRTKLLRTTSTLPYLTDFRIGFWLPALGNLVNPCYATRYHVPMITSPNFQPPTPTDSLTSSVIGHYGVGTLWAKWLFILAQTSA